jgi:transcriptional regulator with XRE-family HTH domain
MSFLAKKQRVLIMKTTEENKNIHIKLRELRRARGLTVNTLAEKMGENHQKVGRIERGRRSLTVDYLVKISKALGTPMESLFVEEDREKKQSSKSSVPSHDILNAIIILVEEYCKQRELNSQQKAKLISKLFELTLNVPPEHQTLFIDSLADTLKTIASLEGIAS